MNKQFIVRGDIPKEPALTIKNQLLLSPGEWKGQKLSREAILEGIKNTNWNSQEARSIIYGHRTNDESTYYGDPSPDEWVGYHSEPKYLTLSDGVNYEGMYADLYIYDSDLASKLAYGNAKAGISEGMEYDYYSGRINKFINSSVVNNPACKLAYLNLSEDSNETQVGLMEPRFLNLAEVTSMEEKRKELGMSVEEFYAVPRDPPSESKLPIFDDSHVRNAMARFNQTDFKNKDEKNKAYKKILKEAEDDNINVDDFKKVGDKLNLAEDTEESEESNEENSNKDERRSNKMEDKIAEMEKRLEAIEATKLNLSEESNDKKEDSNESQSEEDSSSEQKEQKESDSSEKEQSSEAQDNSAADNSSKESSEKEESKEETSKKETSEDKSEKSGDSEKSKPVVMEKKDKDKSDSKSSDDKVVEAINKVGEKMAEEFKKAAKPQSSAATNPDASMSDNDEQVTKRLVEHYNKLHQ